MAFYNENDAAQDVMVHLAELGWDESATIHARDLWAHTDLGTFKGSFPEHPMQVPPHNTRLFKLELVH